MKTAIPLSVMRLTISCICPAQEPGPESLSPSQIEPAIQALWKSLPRPPAASPSRRPRPDWNLKFTPWLPNQWPPTNKTVWSRYAFGLDLSLDGACDVSAPVARMERSAGAHSNWRLIPMEQSLKIIGVHPVRPSPGWHYTLADEARVLDFALALTEPPSPNSKTTRELAAYFQSWRLSHRVIADQVARNHLAFFAWLEAQ